MLSSSLVSVIVPCYKMGRYIGEALASVGSQTFTNWEVIAVDDCGPEDGTREAVEAFAARFPGRRIEYIRHETNGGVSAARNTAIAAARGEFLAFLDPDDLWHRDKLERQVRIMNSYPRVGMVHTQALCVDEIGQPITRQTSAYGIFGTVGSGPPNVPFHAYKECLEDSVFAPAMTVMARRELIEAIGGFPIGLEYQCEDLVVWTRIAKRAAFYFIPEPLACYRLHPGNWTSRQTALSIIDVHLVYLRRIIIDEGMDQNIAIALDRLIDKYRGKHLSRRDRAYGVLRAFSVLCKHGGLPHVAARRLRAIRQRLVLAMRKRQGD